MRILIISYFYAPDISPRAFRWTAISEYWVQHGHKVDVVSAWKPGFLKEEVLKGVHVYRVGGAITELLRSRLQKSDLHFNIEDSQATKPASFSLMQKFAFLAKWIHDQTWKKVYWPDYACLWYFPAWEKAKQLLKLYNYDALISVSHPFTGHLVGLKLKKYYPKIRWIVDIGDPFCFLEYMPTNNFNLYKTLNYAYEEKIFTRANAIAVTTPITCNKYANLFPENALKIKIIPPLLSLGMNQENQDIVFPKLENKIRLLSVGTLHKQIRKPDGLLRLFNQLLQTYLSEKLELHFIGSINNCQEYFQPYEAMLNKKVFCHGILSRYHAFQAMKEADVLVNIGNEVPYQLPSKLVEYASLGKPILNLAKITEDSSTAFLEDYPASFCLLEEETVFDSELLVTLIQFIEQQPCVDANQLKHLLAPFSVEAIAEAYKVLI